MECFGLPNLARIMLLFKVFMTLGFIEPVHLAIITDGHDAVVGVHEPQAKITLVGEHVEPMWGFTAQTLSLRKKT